jgi:hypothetical protein
MQNLHVALTDVVTVHTGEEYGVCLMSSLRLPRRWRRKKEEDSCIYVVIANSK